MIITCNNCKEVMMKYLCDIPSQWRESISKAICLAIPQSDDLDCDDMKKCETLTSLSSFKTSGTTISIIFTDEKHKEHLLTMNLSSVINRSLDSIDPMCLTTPEIWAVLTNQQRFEVIMNSSCNCN